MTLHRHRRTVGLATVAGLLLTACGQPATPLDIGIREVPNDIVLGAQSDDEPAPTPPPPIPPTAVTIDVPVLRPPAPERFDPSPPSLPEPTPPPEAACPIDDPLDAPRHEARRTAPTPPVEETLTYRNDGEFSVSGANANEGTFSGDSTRTVRNVEVADNGDFTYEVVAELAGTTTTTSYEAIVEPPDDTVSPILNSQGVRDDRGLYITSVLTESPDGSTSTFVPNPPMLALPFPSSVGDTFSVRSVDPDSGVVMAYDAAVGDLARVNACGSPLQGITVELSNGTVVGPDINVQFTARYVYATQFGGVSVEDEFTTAGTENGETSSRTNHAIVNHPPSFRPEAVT